MSSVNKCRSKKKNVAAVFQFKPFAQFFSSSREITHCDVGLLYVTEYAVQVMFAKAARIYHFEATSREIVSKLVAGVEVAVAM